MARNMLGLVTGSCLTVLSQSPPAQAAAPAATVQQAPAGGATAASFDGEVRTLFRVVGCGSSAAGPAFKLSSADIAAHCRQLNADKRFYTQHTLRVAKGYLAKLRPADLPRRVVYPFGGGDLTSALLAYPDADQIVELSLEHGGDPRGLARASRREALAALAQVRRVVTGHLTYGFSRSENLMIAESGPLAGVLPFGLIGLAIHGGEPVSLRFFRVTDSGSIAYVPKDDVARPAPARARRLKDKWPVPQVGEPFSNYELTFRMPGDPRVRTYRHVAANLDDGHFGASTGVKKYLDSLRPYAAMIKAGTYLVWYSNFSNIRNTLIGGATWMISDTSGISPYHLKGKGWEQVPLGTYRGPVLDVNAPAPRAAMLKLFEHSTGHVPFRFGYPDRQRHNHLLITRKIKAGTAASAPNSGARAPSGRP